MEKDESQKAQKVTSLSVEVKQSNEFPYELARIRSPPKSLPACTFFL